MRYLFIISVAVLLSHSAIAQQYTEVYFTITQLPKSEIAKLPKGVSPGNYRNDTLWAYADVKVFEALSNAGYFTERLTNPSMLHFPEMANKQKSSYEWDAYPSYELYLQMMRDFASKYPTLCRLDTIGKTDTQYERLILALKISDNVSELELEPEVFYSSSMHGDELVGYVLLLRLADYLLSNYKTDTYVTDLVNKLQIYINPLANPDGAYTYDNSSVYEGYRNNLHGVDLNRNFPDPINGKNPDHKETQAETLVMINYMKKHNFVLSANIHEGAETINYPWDHTYTRHADNQWFIDVSREYANISQQYSTGGYLNDYQNGITNGYDWYPITGGRQDYVNYFLHGREVTMELSANKTPLASTLPQYWEYNYRSLLAYLNNATNGLHATITNAVTNEPITAMLELVGHDQDSSQVATNPSNGLLVRMAETANYHILFTAKGYNAELIRDYKIYSNQPTTLNIPMVALEDNIRPVLHNEFGDEISKLALDAKANESLVIPLQFNDANGDEITILQPIAKNGGWWQVNPNNPHEIIYNAPAVIATDNFTLQFCDNGSPQLCNQFELAVSIDGGVGTPDKQQTKLDVFPNPVNNMLYINIKGTGELNVINVLGMSVFSTNAKAVNMSGLPKGLYLVFWQNKAGTRSAKVLKY